jgi:hypothetical protein
MTSGATAILRRAIQTTAQRARPRWRHSVFFSHAAGRIHLRRTPVPYPRMKIGSRLPDARPMASKFRSDKAQKREAEEDWRR